MDTQGKNKKLVGDYGYVISAKKHYFNYALLLLGACLIVYIIGLLFFDELAPFFTIASVLLILPVAQFLAKYISYAKYKTLTLEEFQKIDAISKDFLVLGELPIIRGKKVYNTLITVITKVGVFSYIMPKKDLAESRKELLDTEHVLNSILKPKNILVTAKVFNDFDIMYDYLSTRVRPAAFSPDDKQLVTIAKIYMAKTH